MVTEFRHRPRHTKSNSSLAFKPTLDDILKLTENNDQRVGKQQIIGIVQSTEDAICMNTRDRKTLQAYNIIDLNVVPINVHALMREMPLINLINYSRTFDELICDLHKTTVPANMNEVVLDDLLNKVDVKEPVKHLFGMMLINPYVDMSYMVYKCYLSSIMRGAMGTTELGRPQYIGDEIYNKALFGEIYPGAAYFEEGHPGVGVGHMHGKKEVLSDYGKNIPTTIDLTGDDREM